MANDFQKKSHPSPEQDMPIRNIFNALPIGVHIYHLEDGGQLIFEGANPAADSILGIDNSIFIGKSIEDAFPSLAKTEIPERYREAASLGKFWKTEQINYSDSKIIGAFEVYAFQINPGRMAAVFMDIKERKQSEEKMKFQNILLKTQQEVSPDGILIVGKVGRILSFNKKFAAMWGIPDQLFTSGSDAPVLDHVYNKVAYPEQFIEKVKYLYSHENESSHDEIKFKDGRIFERHSAPINGEDNTYYGRVWYFRDITGRKKGEEIIIKSESEFRSLFEAIPTGAIMLIDRKFRRVSSRFSKITGYLPDDLIGKPTRLIYLDDETDVHVEKELYATMKQDGIGRCEAKIKKKDGSTIDVMIYASPFDPDNFSKGIAATLEDLTEQKKAEDERERLREELIQSQKMESIGRLAGGIAHDFNNLLTAILGNTELAMLAEHTDKGCKNLEAHLLTIKQAAQSAAELTGQLLAFSRKQIINPKVVNINTIISNMHKMLGRIIGENINLKLNAEVNLNRVKVDVTQIQQIIINLTANARGAMPGGGTLNIDTANVIIDKAFCNQYNYSVQGKHIMIAVSDNGFGMSNETLEHLFEPFYTTKPIGKGTGLGLATVYGAVKQNYGIIHVYSEQGKGTTFKIYFPAVEENISDIPDQAISNNLPGGTETVLLVEDNPLVLEFSASALHLLGYRVISAKNGEEAITIFNETKEKIQLLMTDVILTGINGRVLAETLLNIQPGLKVLYNSGYTENAIVSHGVLKEGLHFIGKPFSTSELAHKIREILDNE